MALDAHVNGAYTTLTATPANPTTDTTFTVANANLLVANAHAILAPAAGVPGLIADSECVYIESASGTSVTVSARSSRKGYGVVSAASGMKLYQPPLAHHFDDIEDPTLFLVNGSAYALTRAGIQAAVDDAAAVDGTVRLCGDVTSDGTSIALPSRVTLDLDGHQLIAPASGACNLVTITGAIGSAVDLASNATMGAKTVVLTTGGGASFAAGDVVRIFEEAVGTDNDTYFSQIAEIRSIASDTLTLSSVVGHAFTTARGATVRKLTPIIGARVINGRFDGNGNADNTRGVYMHYCIDCEIEGEFTDFTKAGVWAESGLRNHFTHLRLERCGDGLESDLMLYRQTDYKVSNLWSHEATGFGPESSGGLNGRWVHPTSEDSGGRGLKLANEGWTEIVAPRTDGARGSYTGLSITLLSHDITVLGGGGQGNESYGLMVDSAKRVKVIGWSGNGNTNGDATIDNINGEPEDVQLIDCDLPGGLVDATTAGDFIVINTKRRDFEDATADPTRSGTLQRNGTALKYHNGTSAIDLTDKTPASHGASLHTDRVRRIPLMPVTNIRTNPGTAISWATDAHSSLPATPHVDYTDGDASFPKLCSALIPVPADFASGAKVVMEWHTPAVSGDSPNNVVVIAAGCRETLDGYASATTLLNEATNNQGIYVVTISSGATEILRTQAFSFSTQPTVGRYLEVFWWADVAHASNKANVSIRGVFLEYTADM